MNNEVKVYTPEIVADSAFPTTGEMAFQDSSGQSTRIAQDTFGAKETAEKGFPLKMVAKELLSTAINTMTQKIVKTFEFVKQGAIQIGEYINGVSGDIRISPDGITARNKSGITTFSIDGDTGDAIFSGDVRAATFTSDYFNVDDKGNVVAQSIKLVNSIGPISKYGTSQTFPGTGAGDGEFSNFALECNLDRDSVLLICLSYDYTMDLDYYEDYTDTIGFLNSGIYFHYEFNGGAKKEITSMRGGGYVYYMTTYDVYVKRPQGIINAHVPFSTTYVGNFPKGRYRFSLSADAIDAKTVAGDDPPGFYSPGNLYITSPQMQIVSLGNS